jgi:hypothetical protein
MPNYTKKRNRKGRGRLSNIASNIAIKAFRLLTRGTLKSPTSRYHRWKFPLSANEISLISEEKERKRISAIPRRATRSGSVWPIKYYTARKKYYYPDGLSSVLKASIKKSRKRR